MIKYSIQNECLEYIEAFTDEQMNREMAVIESVLDVFDKTILMMELSNSDVNIPDCSMFMESAFFQEDEVNTGGDAVVNNASGGGGEVSNTPTADQSSNNNTSSGDNNQNGDNKDTNTKSTFTEKDQKAYNKEHWVRMKTKEGKLENIFISIIAFIPRLLGFLIQCIVKLFKKIFNKDTQAKAEEIDKTPDNVVAEAAQKVDSQLNADDGKTPEADAAKQANADNVDNQAKVDAANGEKFEDTPKDKPGDINKNSPKETLFYDVNTLVRAIDGVKTVIEKLSFNGYIPIFNGSEAAKAQNAINTKCAEFANNYPPAETALKSAIQRTVSIPSKDVYNQTTPIREAFDRLKTVTDNIQSEYKDIGNRIANGITANKNMSSDDKSSTKQTNLNSLLPIKKLCQQLKAFVKLTAADINSLDKAYANYSNNINILVNAIRNTGAGNANANSDAINQVPDLGI